MMTAENVLCHRPTRRFGLPQRGKSFAQGCSEANRLPRDCVPAQIHAKLYNIE